MSNKSLSKSISKNAIYILPNLFTTGSLMTGFSSILLALDHRFGLAAILIFVSMILDGMDGRVARWTNTQSSFGEQYDSLADVIAFGAAPAILVYLWAFKNIGDVPKMLGIGWFASLVYLSCTALRLARFNVQLGQVDKRFFVGLPSPSGAALVAGAVLIGTQFKISGHDVSFFMVILTIYAGLMMVSNFLFFSFKTFDIKKVKFSFLSLIIVYGALLFAKPSIILFLTIFVYALSGPIHYFIRRYLRKRRLQDLNLKRKNDSEA